MPSSCVLHALCVSFFFLSFFFLSDSTQVVEEEGMPRYKNPFEKGHLLIQFKVEFPTSNFADSAQLQVSDLRYDPPHSERFKVAPTHLHTFKMENLPRGISCENCTEHLQRVFNF